MGDALADDIFKMLYLCFSTGLAFHGNDVELPGLAAFGMLLEIRFRGGQHMSLFASCDRVFRIGKGMGTARLDLHEQDQVVFAGDDVNFAVGCVVIACQDGVATRL